MLERVEVGDPQRVGAHRTGARASPGTDPDAVVLGPVDEVGDDEEVAAETHLGDHADLEVGLLANVVGDAGGVTELQARLDLLDEPRRLVLALGNVEHRHVGAAALGELDVAPLRDQQRVVTGLTQAVLVLPEVPHLGGGLDVVAVAVEPEPLGVRHHAAAGDAQEMLVGRRVGLVDVVGVVGGDRRDAEVLAELEQAVADPGLDVETVVHQLEEVVVLPDDVLEVGRRLPCLLVVTDPQPGLDLPRRAAGGGDQAVGVLGQQLAVGARLVEEALHAGPAGEPEQVVHAGRGLGEQGHVGVGAAAGDVVVAAVVPPDPLLVVAGGVGGEVGLHPDDRLDPRGRRLGVEVVGPEHVAVVGHRDRVHAQLGGPLEHVAQPRRPVEHGVLGVDVEVGEGVGRHLCGGAPRTSVWVAWGQASATSVSAPGGVVGEGSHPKRSHPSR